MNGNNQAFQHAGRQFVRPVEDSRTQISRGLFVFFCSVTSVDFKSLTAGSGSAFQIALGILTTFTFILFVINAARPKYRSKVLSSVTWLWWVFLISTPFVAVYRNVPMAHFVRTVLPQFMMGESLAMCLILFGQDERNKDFVFKCLFYASAVSAVVNAVNGFSSGKSIDVIRYFILSPVLTVNFGMALCRLLVEGRKAGVINIMSLLGGLVLLYLSQTRSYIGVIGAILLGIMIMLLRPPTWLSRRVRNNVWKNLTVAAVMLVVASVSVIIIFPTVLTGWQSRTSTLGSQDPTALTRIAEAAGEIEAMEADLDHLVIGSGFGSDHIYDATFLIGVPADDREAGRNEPTDYPGHIVWPYQFYAAGLLFGWAVPLIIAITIWCGYSRFSSYTSRIATIVLGGVLIQMSFGNILGDRSGGMTLGLLIALALHKTPLEKRQEQLYKSSRKLVRNKTRRARFRGRPSPSFTSSDA